MNLCELFPLCLSLFLKRIKVAKVSEGEKTVQKQNRLLQCLSVEVVENLHNNKKIVDITVDWK